MSRTYRLARAALGPAVRAAYDIGTDGIHHVPTIGPVILAPNHRSFMDSVFLPAVVSRPVSFIAKAEYFDKRVTAWMFRVTEQIPVRRGSPAGARQALAAARVVLDAGGAIGIYPEGTRSRDGRLLRGTLGPARLSLVSNAPIIPVGLIGTGDVQAPGQRLPRLGKRITIRFGEPLWPDLGRVGDRAYMRQLTDQLMHAIAQLSGQAYIPRRAESAVHAGV